MKKEKNIDILEGNLLKNLVLFALPILLSSFLQQFFNSADSAVVGRFVGKRALAAVSGNAAMVNLLINIFNGLSTGAGVTIAQLIGENKPDRIKKAVPTIMISGFLSGVILTVMGFFITKPLLIILKTPSDVIDLAVLYLKIYFFGMPFYMTLNFGIAVLRSNGETRKPLYALTASGITNIILNLFFVIVLDMGVSGVGIATVISNIICAAIVLIMLIKDKGCIKLTFRGFRFDSNTFSRIARIGMPAGLQGMTFSVSNMIIQSAINSFGSSAVAACAAAVTFEHLSYFICNSLSQAAMTFTSQNYGAEKYDRCRKIFRCALIAGTVGELIFDVVVIVFRKPLVSIFTTDSEVIIFACSRMMIAILFHFMISSYEVPAACLRGYGISMQPALITLAGCCGIRLAWVFFVLPLHRTYQFLFLAYPISWCACGIAMLICYVRNLRKLTTK